MTEFRILGLEFKNIIVIFVSALEFVFSLSLMPKKKKKKIGTNNILFGFAKAGIWNQKYRICLMENVVKQRKCQNLGPKKPHMGFFTIIFLKNYCHVWNQHTWICLIAKFRKKAKMSKFGTEKVYLCIFRLIFETSILIFEINNLEFV